MDSSSYSPNPSGGSAVTPGRTEASAEEALPSSDGAPTASSSLEEEVVEEEEEEHVVNGWDDDDNEDDDLLLAIDEEFDEGRVEDAEAVVVAATHAADEDDNEPAEEEKVRGVPADPGGANADANKNATATATATTAPANGGGDDDDDEASTTLHHQPSSLSTIENPAQVAAASTTPENGPTVGGPRPLPPLPSPPIALLSSSSIMERRVSVTSNRKSALLAEAREDRARWIQKVSLPYQRVVPAPSSSTDDDDALRRSELSRTHAVQHLPSSIQLLSHLYQGGLGNAAAISGDSGGEAPIQERIRAALDSAKSSISNGNSEALISDDADDALWSGTSGPNEDEDHRSYVRLYRNMVRILQDPSCAVLVQGMRNFCKKLVAATNDPKDVANKIRSYLSGILPTLASNPAWNVPQHLSSASASSSRIAPTDDGTHRRRALEAFLYGQCRSHLESLLWNDSAQRRESEWMARMNDLQFVTPRHLEIGCLSHSGNDVDNESIDVDELLKDCAAALVSVDTYYSPYDKLQRILALYRCVNAALSRALNHAAPAAPTKKLPSADDVLPTIILVVLRAKPRRLLLNLQFVEDCAPPEALRGEAGYAYTNLYGAVQFLTDLDLEGGTPDHLSMSADEFRQGLQSCRDQAKERLKNQPAATTPASSFPNDDLEEEPVVEISPVEVRAARRQGVALDVEWALQLRRDHPHHLPSTVVPQPGLPLSASVSDELVADVLPMGFSRSYSFLNARPDDIRMSDLPQLLDEYRMLVHTTEVLLSEKSSRIRAERKAQRRAAERELYRRVNDVDPSLLVPHHSSSASSKASGAARSRPSATTMNGGI